MVPALDPPEEPLYVSMRELSRQPVFSPVSSIGDEVDLGNGAVGGSEEGADEEAEDSEVTALLASPLRRDSSLERPRRPSLRRSRRTASDGGSPLVEGLPYTGRRFCEYN